MDDKTTGQPANEERTGRTNAPDTNKAEANNNTTRDISDVDQQEGVMNNGVIGGAIAPVEGEKGSDSTSAAKE